MVTREKILEAALRALNRDGYARSSVRSIATECGIRPGNLTYHFPRKNDIVIALFRQIREVSTGVLLRERESGGESDALSKGGGVSGKESVSAGKMGKGTTLRDGSRKKRGEVTKREIPEFLQTMFREQLRLIYDYRFLFVDLVLILHEVEPLLREYRELSALRRRQFLEMLQSMESSGLLRRKPSPEEREALYDQLVILTNFWISSAAIEEPEVNLELVDRYADSLAMLFSPWIR